MKELDSHSGVECAFVLVIIVRPALGSCLALSEMTWFDRLSVGAAWAEEDVSFLHRSTLGRIHSISFLKVRRGQGLIIMFSSNAIVQGEKGMGGL